MNCLYKNTNQIMTFNPDKHHRRSIRLKDYNYSQTGAYFVTICTYNKQCSLSKVVGGLISLSRMGKIASEFWLQIPSNFKDIKLDEFVVMPNHIHGILINVGAIHELPLPQTNKIERRKMLIPKIIGFYKMNTAKYINQLQNTTGLPVWQRNYYEHIIRDEDKLNKIKEYIQDNPLQRFFDRENPEKSGNYPLEDEIFKRRGNS